MSAPDPAELGYLVRSAMRQADQSRPRSDQNQAGLLGPSDIGWCRQKALLTVKRTTPSDNPPMMSAYVGTALGERVERDVHTVYGWPVQVPVTIRLRNITFSGHIDILRDQQVIDNKSKDGFALVRRHPWTDNHDYQTWLYCLGAVQGGLVKADEPVWQTLVFLDRSGKEDDPLVVHKQWDPSREDEIYSWFSDVIYARTHDEDASRDVPAPVCERICEFFTVCRGDLPIAEPDVITDPEVIEWVRLYDELGTIERQAAKDKRSIREQLLGVNGRAGNLLVRWTHVNETQVPGYERDGYDKIQVTKARG